QGGGGRVDDGDRRRVTRGDGDRGGVARALVVGDTQTGGVYARGGVRERGGRGGRIAEYPLAVEVPGVAERPTLRVGRARPVEGDRERDRAVGGVGRHDRGRWLVGGGERDAVNGAVFHVDVEQVAAGADLQVDRMAGTAAGGVDADER